jgi:hypothetical protein
MLVGVAPVAARADAWTLTPAKLVFAVEEACPGAPAPSPGNGDGLRVCHRAFYGFSVRRCIGGVKWNAGSIARAAHRECRGSRLSATRRRRIGRRVTAACETKVTRSHCSARGVRGRRCVARTAGHGRAAGVGGAAVAVIEVTASAEVSTGTAGRCSVRFRRARDNGRRRRRCRIAARFARSVTGVVCTVAAISAGRKCAIAGGGDWLHATGCGRHGLAAGCWYLRIAINGVCAVSALDKHGLCAALHGASQQEGQRRRAAHQRPRQN